MRVAVLVFGTLFAMHPVVFGKVIHSVVVTDERMLIPLSDAFGFSVGGKLTFSISNIAIYQQHKTTDMPDYNHMGFFLSPMEADTALEADLEAGSGQCILDSIERNSLPKFADSLIRKVISGESSEATFDFTLENGGLFFLYFANCDVDTPVSFDMHIEVRRWHSRLSPCPVRMVLGCQLQPGFLSMRSDVQPRRQRKARLSVSWGDRA